ncbi:hypothetical protein CDL12_12730 [Handroanthus impetiginosus]|uniref:Uncharacterized protein n=1 Tax=Handroanthus impetiginosus TaxID=429701 RepID=A0A2G9HAU1_9LAMI|nr:hypothetical protein CDL12_12730 [Handroanthus impetiginosus]
MEAVVDIVVNEEAALENCSTSQKTSDPVVYQLVRVDGNGRLVPATDDEVKEVENLLEDDKNKVKTAETRQTLECSTDYGCRPSESNKVLFKGSEGQPQPEVPEVGAEKSNVAPDPAMDSEHEERTPSMVSNASDGRACQSGSPEGCPKLLGGLDESKTSSSPIDTSSKPDFSLLNGEIRLDNLSVKDLQETFRATFGRETSVKDKQWLKRRIIMGLTNSCDFSTTTFVIIDNKVVKQGKEETCKSEDCSVLVDCVVTSAMENNWLDKQNEIHSIATGTKIESSTFQDNCGSNDADTEERPAKRVRKPTKRYIEEISEGEPRDFGAKIISSVNHPAQNQSSSKVSARAIQNFGVDRRCLTRKDSLGGSGIQVPYVSRIRRSRPRENYMTLMKFQPSGMGTSTRLEENDVESSKQHDNEGGNEVIRNSLSPRWIQEPPVASSESCEPYTEKNTTQLEKEVKVKSMESYETSSDDVVTVPTANGGMRRKHHRPWTLNEVVKLVEGVAKYGAGRWSEIKRVAFASYSYRTSVDLKDKWRNLLRASLAELPTGNGINSSRKQASVPIPASILSRVRELADLNAQASPSLTSSKLAGHNDSNKTVHETGPGHTGHMWGQKLHLLCDCYTRQFISFLAMGVEFGIEYVMRFCFELQLGSLLG